VVAPTHLYVKTQLAMLVANLTSQGMVASSFAPCVSSIGGILAVCSNQGICSASGQCQCDQGFDGTYCQLVVQTTSREAIVVGAVLGSVLPMMIILCLVLGLLAVGLWLARNKKVTNEWEVNIDELEMGAEIGAGALGVVHKAMWKGTEVAVKTLIASSSSSSNGLTKEMESNFIEEVLRRVPSRKL